MSFHGRIRIWANILTSPVDRLTGFQQTVKG
jgi:hypothetical protein